MPARRFAAQETTTYRDLQNTMKRLGATSLRVSPRDLMNPKDVQVEVVFDRAGKRYVVRCRKWADWLDNLRATERTIFYLYRAIDVLALGSGSEAWWDVLGVKQGATKAEVINAYRALLQIHHPDTGGTADTFKRLRRAYEQALNGLSG